MSDITDGTEEETADPEAMAAPEASPAAVPDVAAEPAMPPGAGRTTRTQSVATPAETQAAGAVQGALGQQATIQRQLGENAANNPLPAEEQAARAAVDADYQAHVKSVWGAADTEYKAHMGAYDRDIAKLRSMKQTGYFEGRPGAAIASAFAVALGAYGASITHTQNYAQNVIDQAVDEHAKKQAEEFSRSKDFAINERTEAEDAKREGRDSLALLSASKVAAYEKISADFKAKAQQFAGTQAGLRAQQQAAALDQKAAEEREKFANTQRERITTSVKNHLAGGAGGGGAGYNPKVERANSQQLTEIDREAQKFAKTNGLDVAGKAYVELDAALAKLKATKDPATQIAVLDSFIRANRGGSATAQSMKQQLEHLGGVGATIQGMIEKGDTGGLGPDKLANLVRALEAARAETGSQIGNVHKDFVDTFYTGARYQQKGNWEEKENELFGRFGVHARPDKDAPTIVPGSGRRSIGNRGVNARAGGGSAPAAEAAPAAAAPKLSGKELAGAMDWLAKNPNDPRAAAVRAKVAAARGQ